MSIKVLDWIKELFAKDIDLDSKISNLKASSMLQEASLSGSGDLNDLRKVNKWYFINSASGILNLPPFPTLNNSAVYISGGGTGVFTQIYCANESGRLFFRRFVSWNNPQWGVWKEVATTDKIDISPTPSTGITIIDNKSYIQNGVKYFSLRVRKTDNTDFASGSTVTELLQNIGLSRVHVFSSMGRTTIGSGFWIVPTTVYTNGVIVYLSCSSVCKEVAFTGVCD